MNEARTNMLEAAARDPRWSAWAEPTPGLYTYNLETGKAERLTTLETRSRELLTLEA
jgi:hypothetical protein